MDLLDKFTEARKKRAALNQHGVNPTGVLMEAMHSATEATILGRRTILAGTNNYLGLTFDPDCIAAGQAALATYGTGTTGSRMANGNFACHEDLERELADFYECEHALVFSTGYGANLAAISALVAPGDAVLLDADAHASLYDGCKLSGADIYRFKHSDPDSLDRRLRRLADRAASTLVVVEGLYSILGDYPPLADMVAVCREHGAYLLVDEAHSLGVLGERGRGLAEAEGVIDQVDFIVGTFSKSLGATGGYCVSRHDALDLFRYTARPYIFTASPCPSVIATTRQALQILRERPELRTRLWQHAERLYNGFTGLGLNLGPMPSPVVAVRFERSEAALDIWQRLLDNGVYTNLIVPPASPDGSSLIRCSLSAAHTSEQIDKILDAMAKATSS